MATKKTPPSKVPEKEVTKSAPNVKRTVKKGVKSVVKSDTACMCRHACRPEEAFWINNGPVVASIAELKQAFREMSDEQYAYHTAREGNDFARWMRDCLNDTVRAERVEKAKTKTAAMRALSEKCCK